ncbi:50S ribosomal protein L9 [Lutibacter maritimus]|jgi:large subunit ribosomal protein L9|uniref:Large ribosomal subunit protein bL9 n=1 Tax=Lutibacter maritimus TaxID=593133 RepID=A0A1I6P3G0_9FLAO|nr:50S ribosomal protein L9 [Lutibacter maritimus]SFS34756.1 LSU ribosomal protein L9P [Lutibacter maritimus]
MEIILKQDVENLGFIDDIVTVKNGYGRNFLIPQGLAVLATTSAKKVLAETLKQRAFKEEKLIKDATVIADALKELDIKITAKTADSSKLFGSVNNADVAEALAAAGQVVDKKYIKVEGGNIKRIGKYNATIRLHRSVVVELPIDIIAEAK